MHFLYYARFLAVALMRNTSIKVQVGSRDEALPWNSFL